MFLCLQIFLSSIALANPINIFGEIKLGTSNKKVYRTLKRKRLTVKSQTYTDPNGLSFGLLKPPGLLAMMNRHQVPNPLLAQLPKKGPTFYRFKSKGHHVLFIETSSPQAPRRYIFKWGDPPTPAHQHSPRAE